jgi:hypothetical protein
MARVGLFAGFFLHSSFVLLNSPLSSLWLNCCSICIITLIMALLVGYHLRGAPSVHLITEDGVSLGRSVIARPHLTTRADTYADMYHVNADGSYQCLGPNCRCSSGRVADGFGFFFKHLSLWHFGEITSQDTVAALTISSSKMVAVESSTAPAISASAGKNTTIADSCAGSASAEHDSLAGSGKLLELAGGVQPTLDITHGCEERLLEMNGVILHAVTVSFILFALTGTRMSRRLLKLDR